MALGFRHQEDVGAAVGPSDTELQSVAPAQDAALGTGAEMSKVGRPQRSDDDRRRAVKNRDKRVIELRRQRYTFPQIAEIIEAEFGDDAAGMKTLHYRYTQQLRDIPKAEADQHRAEMVDQLDDLERKALTVMGKFHFSTNNNGVIMWEQPDGTLVPLSDDMPALESIRTLVAIQQRKSKLLGLDAPTQVQATIRPPTEADIALIPMIEQLEKMNAIEAAKIVNGEVERATDT